MEYISNSAQETEALGERLAARLRPGDVIAYTGDLGAGKTAWPGAACVPWSGANTLREPLRRSPSGWTSGGGRAMIRGLSPSAMPQTFFKKESSERNFVREWVSPLKRKFVEEGGPVCYLCGWNGFLTAGG